ncbi:MAG: NAD(P)-dependent oxidoreductase [SAR202 cluster bacterium]|nr:NAD(P)-dependent oxidoreductase [SAR202 cluster bacterium]
MTVMVTGGNGFIGQRIVRILLARGEEVVSFDMAPPRSGSLNESDKFSFYRGDITQIPHLTEAINANSVDRIIHMAALLPPDTEDRPHFGMLVNIQGTNNVFEVARWTGVQRVVYASSISVYGTQEPFGDRLINEDDHHEPVNVYGMTKSANDFSASAYRQRFDLDIRGVRICTVFGHGRVTGMTGMIGGLLASLPAIGEPIDLPFHPDEASSMIHAEDAAEIFVRITLADNLNHPVYISGGHLCSVADMADQVRTFIPDAKITTGDQRVPHVYLVDNSRMLADIGYELAPLSLRIKEHINDARREAGMPSV